jgi:hypothetical protein
MAWNYFLHGVELSSPWGGVCRYHASTYQFSSIYISVFLLISSPLYYKNTKISSSNYDFCGLFPPFSSVFLLFFIVFTILHTLNHLHTLIKHSVFQYVNPLVYAVYATFTLARA